MKHLIEIAYQWGVRCFGNEHMHNRKVRGLRFAEEAIELAQALDVPQDVMTKLVATVYSRPPGDAYQEVGGSMVTLGCLCRTMGVDPEHALLWEINRVLAKDPLHFAKRNQDKIDLELDA